MKKIVKLTGITTAVLMITAPIFTTMIDPITTVKADDPGPDYQAIIDNIDPTKLQSIADEIKANIQEPAFRNFDKDSVVFNLLGYGFDMGPVIGITDGGSVLPYSQLSSNVGGLLDTGIFENGQHLSEADGKYLDDNIVLFDMKIYDANGTQITTLDNLNALQDSDLKVDIDMKYMTGYVDNKPIFDGSIPVIKDTKVSYNTSKVATSKLEYQKDITVKAGTAASDIRSSDYGNAKLIDTTAGSDMENTTIGSTRTATSDGMFFSDEASAEQHLNGSTTGQVDAGDPLLAGTYYRVVNANLIGLAMGVIVDGDGLTVDGDAVQYKLPTSNAGSTFDFVQKVTVTPKNSGNTDTTSGIATTHNDKINYSLYNDNNEKVDNRALAPVSSWKVDKARTINGVKQYRVSTHEWVNASDVDFVSGGSISDGLTIKKLDTAKEISLSTDHNIYNLENSKQEVSTTRALAGGTNWLVDKIGTDSHGGIYYGVSTDEFVKASDGVSVVK
ncbi:hypothetical protein [Companilactobacillus keshanensis]|uniref:Surface layer protein A domain-containing protein n=1 Tax=Companilactobacillus keshanensis TaxID=2486003 RepID=A0ABW4BVY7_9LACO|nr:hypothetical protein [Companilactobacillus keshanensis]